MEGRGPGGHKEGGVRVFVYLACIMPSADGFVIQGDHVFSVQNKHFS